MKIAYFIACLLVLCMPLWLIFIGTGICKAFEIFYDWRDRVKTNA